MLQKQTKILFESPRLLTICRSYRRPHALKTLYESWDATHSEHSEIIVYLSTDDPKLQEYENVIAGRSYVIEDHRFFGGSINYVIHNVCPEIPYYQGIGDDHVYVTNGWDNIMLSTLDKMNGWGIVAANDHVDKDWYTFRHTSAEVFSWKFAKHLNGPYPNNNFQFGADVYFEQLLWPIGLLVMAEDAVIEHHCWHATGKGENDDNQKFNYSNEQMDGFMSWFYKWRDNDMQAIHEKLKKAINEDSSIKPS